MKHFPVANLLAWYCHQHLDYILALDCVLVGLFSWGPLLLLSEVCRCRNIVELRVRVVGHLRVLHSRPKQLSFPSEHVPQTQWRCCSHLLHRKREMTFATLRHVRCCGGMLVRDCLRFLWRGAFSWSFSPTPGQDKREGREGWGWLGHDAPACLSRHHRNIEFFGGSWRSPPRNSQRNIVSLLESVCSCLVLRGAVSALYHVTQLVSR